MGHNVVASNEPRLASRGAVIPAYGVPSPRQVLVSAALLPEHLDQLRRNFEVTELATDDGRRTVDLRGCGSAGAWIAAGPTLIGARELDALPSLRVISNFGVGLDHIDLASAAARGVTVCNTPGILDGAVAELAMALIFALARQIVPADEYVRSGGWSDGLTFPLGHDIRGATLGIIGLGRIGARLCGLATAVGMHVLYATRSEREPAGFSPRPVRCTRQELLSRADYVSLHMPLTPSTRASFGAADFRLMKPSAHLINTSRGAVVDQAALLDALRNGVIAGAGLDVLETEPPQATDGICAMPNVVLLPHIGSATISTRRAMGNLCLANLADSLEGRPPRGLVALAAV